MVSNGSRILNARAARSYAALRRAANYPLSLPPYCKAFMAFLRFLAECEFAFRHFSIELESGAAVSTVHNPAR
jgi:hypothetical protein